MMAQYPDCCPFFSSTRWSGLAWAPRSFLNCTRKTPQPRQHPLLWLHQPQRPSPPTATTTIVSDSSSNRHQQHRSSAQRIPHQPLEHYLHLPPIAEVSQQAFHLLVPVSSRLHRLLLHQLQHRPLPPAQVGIMFVCFGTDRFSLAPIQAWV